MVQAAVSRTPPSTGNAAFGPGPTFANNIGFDIAVSEDKKAFTATFSGLDAIIDGRSASPVASRTFSFCIPLSDADSCEEIPFFVSGFAASQKGANAHLMITVNDQTSVTDFPANTDGSFVQRLNYKPGAAAEALGYLEHMRQEAARQAEEDGDCNGYCNPFSESLAPFGGLGD